MSWQHAWHGAARRGGSAAQAMKKVGRRAGRVGTVGR